MCGGKATSKMRNVAKQAPLLEAFRVLNKKQLKAVIRDAHPNLIHSICEVCHNLLKANIPLSNCQLKKVKKHKKVIRALAAKGQSVSKKKKILNQRGGFAFLPLLAPLLASAIGGIVGKAVGKRI